MVFTRHASFDLSIGLVSLLKVKVAPSNFEDISFRLEKLIGWIYFDGMHLTVFSMWPAQNTCAIER